VHKTILWSSSALEENNKRYPSAPEAKGKYATREGDRSGANISMPRYVVIFRKDR
jgi:hypothetical protein